MQEGMSDFIVHFQDCLTRQSSFGQDKPQVWGKLNSHTIPILIPFGTDLLHFCWKKRTHQKHRFKLLKHLLNRNFYFFIDCCNHIFGNICSFNDPCFMFNTQFDIKKSVFHIFSYQDIKRELIFPIETGIIGVTAVFVSILRSIAKWLICWSTITFEWLDRLSIFESLLGLTNPSVSATPFSSHVLDKLHFQGTVLKKPTPKS